MSWRDRLPNWKTESDTEYNGPFSYNGEFHAFAQGIGLGFSMQQPKRLRKKPVPAFTTEKGLEEAARESWYFGGGIGIGSLLAFGLWAVVLAALALVVLALL